ncbi:MAG: P-loop NTPase fold protein [Dehalococcoides mccartyi]|uniref:P-loop NTPase fold protein n=1 Tax=Dehalococcoides mccartyi TaxID=61435 RepID=UPI0030F780E8
MDGFDNLNDKDKDNQEVCPTYIIEDSPVTQDRLSFDEGIGPHERIAKAIAEIVCSDESGGKIIALEGEWGSGKSTVVNLLMQKLKENKNILVFSFDAWAHEGDPLRRTYLESLIRHLQKRNWIDTGKWDKNLDKLTKRFRVVKTTTTQGVTTFGKILAISAFLVPIGIPFINAAFSITSAVIDDNIVSQIHLDIWTFIVGLIFAGAPLLVTIGNSVYIKYLKRPRSDSDKEKDSKDWAILAGKLNEQITQDMTETPDPTSIEFEEYFNQLMLESIGGDPNKKIVMVIDNLDRVDPNVAQTNWSTLQTFLLHHSKQGKKWLKQFWTIVPYDENSMKKVWSNRDHVEGSEKQKAPISFIDKTFQIRFEVPPPVLSNWKSYLKGIAASSLPKHTEADYDEIFNVFDVYRSTKDYTPTPRDLILYINQIGVIHRQWQHEFPISHVAYYSILRRDSINIRKSLLTRNISPIMIDICPPNLLASLAGLYFNVKAKLGMQLLLNDPIAEALTQGNSSKLTELEQYYKDGFWAVFDEFIISYLVGINANELTKKVLCISKSKILENQLMAITVIKNIGRRASSITDWAPLDENISAGIAEIIRLTSNKSVSKSLISNIQTNITEQPSLSAPEANKENNFPQIHITISGLVKICKQISEVDQQDIITSPFVLPIDAQGWVLSCTFIHQQDKEYWSKFRPNLSFDELSTFICKDIGNGNITKNHFDTIEVTQSSFDNCNWGSVVQALSHLLDAGQNIDNDKTRLILDIFQLLWQCENNKIASELERLVNEGHLMHRLHQAHTANFEGTKEFYIAMILKYNSGIKQSSPIGNSDAGYNILEKLLNTDDPILASDIISNLKRFGELGILFLVRKEQNDELSKLVLRCLRIIADDEETLGDLYTPAAMLSNWAYLRTNLIENQNQDRFSSLIKNLCEKHNFTERIIELEGETGFKNSNAGLYTSIIEAFPTSKENFTKWCQSGLETMSCSDWAQDLSNRLDAVKLIIALIRNDIHVKLGKPFKDALVKQAKGLLDGTNNISEDLKKQWPNVLSVLGENNERKTLRRELRDLAAESDGKFTDIFFDIYGEEIANIGILLEEKTIVHKLFNPLLRERNIGGLKWLVNLFSKNPNMINKCTDTASIQEFYAIVKEMISQSHQDQEQECILKIAEILKIEPKSDECPETK